MSTGNIEPTPQFESAPPPAGMEKAQEQAVERAGPQETQRPSSQPKQTTDQSVAPPVIPAAPPPVAPVADDTSQPVSSATRDLHAEESDLIEKEWVQRAKHIVSSTQDDPYKQKSEISKAKADYIQKRFNKTIKVDDSFGKAQSRPGLSRTDDSAGA
ncbi:hypothetical protein COU91_01570 [Candidatus Saccharibacteria bacterium CG10_big_fil_rev_8_21_14_0_10_47_8]|nr:MAG: hypothetical protein COU91_01570 [Candidatus Saccharibacteria bacterium CG10_big_fil_rev_8_21_14_0_10_47_8]